MAQVTAHRQHVTQTVSQKVAKIRWLTDPGKEVGVSPPGRFVIGSWDDGKCGNNVSIWKVLFTDDPSTMDEEERKSGNIQQFQLVSELKMDGEVTELKLLGDGRILVGSAKGGMSLLKEAEDGKSLDLVACWDGLHKLGDLPCSLAGISIFGSEAVTCGEDGGLCRVDVESGKEKEAVKMASTPGGYHSVKHNTKDQVIVGCSASRLELWDVRSQEGPVISDAFPSVGKKEGNAVTCLAIHPEPDHHLLAAGTEGGALGFYDLRYPYLPVSSLLHAHSEAIWETMFHPMYPDNLLTCSEEGSVIRWDASSLRLGVSKYSRRKEEEEGPLNPWTLGPALAEKVHRTYLQSETEQFLPINSLDIWGNSVIFRTDSESLEIIRDLVSVVDID